MEDREAGLAAQRAERAKNDRMRYFSSSFDMLKSCYADMCPHGCHCHLLRMSYH